MSNTRQQAAFFDDRDGSGALLQRVRVYDFDLRDWQYKTLLGQAVLMAPVSVAYRPQDDAYYLLDRATSHGRRVMRLHRIPAGYTVQQLAEWPDTGAFDTYGITAGADGLLLVTASSAHHHAFARLRPDIDRVHLTGLFFGSGKIVVPAFANSLDITFMRQTSRGDMIEELRSARHAGRGERDDDDDEEREEGEELDLDHARRMF